MKNFIKNNLKVFVTMIITTIIVGSVSVYAASQYFARDISFTPTNENFKKENGERVDNVEDALNELYLMKDNSGNSIFSNYFYSDKRVEKNSVAIELEKGKYICNISYVQGTSNINVKSQFRNDDSSFENSIESCETLSNTSRVQYAVNPLISDSYIGIVHHLINIKCDISKKEEMKITFNKTVNALFPVGTEIMCNEL